MYKSATFAACILISLITGCATTSPAPHSPTPATRPARPDTTPLTAANSVVRKDVLYVPGGTDKQTLDIYSPAGVKDAPVILFVHGGEWHKGDKTELSYKPRFLNEHGLVLVSLNYRLSGTDHHPAQVNDIATAIRWCRDHASEFGASSQNIYLMGHSAGCHLVTLVGLDPRPLAAVGMRPADLKGVISWSGGSFDLVAKVAEEGMYAKYIRIDFGPDPAVWRDASPMAHVGDSKPMPRFLFVSPGDGNPGSKLASDKMASLIQSAGGSSQSAVLPGKDHFYSDHELGMPGDTSGQILLNFVTGAEDKTATHP